jgi:hypothetical protein
VSSASLPPAPGRVFLALFMVVPFVGLKVAGGTGTGLRGMRPFSARSLVPQQVTMSPAGASGRGGALR